MTIYTLIGIAGIFTAVAVPAVLVAQRGIGLRRIAAKEREEVQP